MKIRLSSILIPLLVALVAYLGAGTVFYFFSTTQEKFLYALTTNTIFFPFILGWSLYRHLDQLELMLIAIVTAAFAAELGNFVLNTVLALSNLLIFYLYTLFEYLLITTFFYRAVERPLARRILGWSIPFFAGIWLMSMVWLIAYNEPDAQTMYINSIITMLESVLLTSFAVYVIVEQTKEHLETVFSLPSFWVGLGVLTYFSGNLITFALGMFTKMGEQLWIVHAFNNVLLNLSYTIGFTCRKRSSQP